MPIYWIRLERGVTLEDLAAWTGISKRMIVVYEYGVNEPKVSVALKLAKALETTVERLFGIPYSR